MVDQETLRKRIAFRISLLKSEKQVTWATVAEGCGYNSSQALSARLNRGLWRVEELMTIADWFKAPFMYFICEEDDVDKVLGRKPQMTEDEEYAEHRMEIQLAKAGSEIRARDARIQELQDELSAKEQALSQLNDVKPSGGKLSEITAKQLRLSIALCEAVADAMEGLDETRPIEGHGL